MGAKWTDEEIATLREMWQSPIPMKHQMHRLPGRGAEYAFRMARKLGLGLKNRSYSKMLFEIEKLMSDGKPRTARDVFKEIDIELSHARDLLTRLVSEQRAHIPIWRQTGCNGQWQAIYLIGKGESQPKPRPMTQKQRTERFLSRLDPVEIDIMKQRYAARKRKAPRVIDPITQALFGRAA